jgi:superfamily II DNA helicase RecQ
MEPIIHLPEFQVVVCRECKYAVLPSEIDSHFKGQRPHSFTKEARQRIVQKVGQFKGLIPNKVELEQSEFPFPVDTSKPVGVLGLPKSNGLRCTHTASGKECPHIYSSAQKMREHCNKKHDWKSTNIGGRPKGNSVQSGPRVPWRSGVQYQQFFKQGPKSGFFEVMRNQESIQMPVQTTAWEQVQQRITEGFQKVEEVHQQKIKATDESREPNPWLRRVGWVQHLSGLDRTKLVELVGPVNIPEEPELEVIHQAFTQLIRTTQKTGVAEVVGRAALFEANRKEASKKATKPFNSRMDKTTFHQYTTVWKQLLSYIWRVRERKEDQDEELPMFKITEQQEIAAYELERVVERVVQSQEQSGSEGLEEVKRQVEKRTLQFCIALLDHQLGDDEYKSGIISGLAVLGMQEGGRWSNAKDYTPKLSAVIKLARLMVIQQAYQGRQASIVRYKERGYTPDQAEESARSHIELVQQMNQKFMMLTENNTAPHPMDWIYDTRSYGLHIRYSTPSEGSISWRGDIILYQNIQFSMQQVRSMVHGLVAEVRTILMQDMLMLQLDAQGDIQGEALPSIDWVSLADNPAEQSMGWSFLKDVRNQFNTTVAGREWVARRVVDGPLSQEFIQSSDARGVQWRRTRVDQYYRAVVRFQEQLLVLMHLTGGQAARAPEIISIRHQNSSNGGVRNIFIDDGLVLFVTAYHKGYEYSEKAKLIQRFLPREVGELLVYYLWLALPFFETLQVVVDGVYELSAFVWGDEISHSRAEEDGVKGSERGRSRVERTDMIGVAEESERGRSRVERTDMIGVAEELERGNQQTGREAEGAQANNIRQRDRRELECTKENRPQFKAWTSERMRKIMQQESTKRMGVRLNISAWRQISIAIARKFIREEYRFDSSEGEAYEGDDFDKDNQQGDSAWDLQSGHETRMAGMVYARLLSEGEFETQSQKERYRTVSQEWHRFLGFKSATEGLGRIGRKRKRSHWEEANRKMQQLRQKQLQQANVQARLEMMLGKDARFRGLQRPAIEAIIQGHSPVVVIMGTGGGKSMLFMLPASCTSGGSTVVIVPLVALQGDLQERCSKARISSVVWNSQRPYDTASIILVTPESAMSKTFSGFINRLQEMHQLDRIVIDEWHTMLDSSPSFRPKLRTLGELALLGVQMVYLTATLPPRDEGEIFRLMHIDRSRDNMQMFRSRTSRSNVQYQVHEVALPPEGNALGWGPDKVGFDAVIHEAVVRLVGQKLEQYPAPAKIIIYCSIIKAAEGLADALGCKIYHRNVDSKEGKAQRLTEWRNVRDDGRFGQGRTMVSTNALGLGIDVPDIRVVMHVGKIWSLRDYAQESGRAGRDGQQSEAIIVRSRGPNGDEYRVGEVVDMPEFIEGGRCRREVLDQVMDAPRDRVGCTDGEEQCDVCQRSGCFQDSGFGSVIPSQADDITFPSSPPVPVAAAAYEAQHQRERNWVQQRVIQQRQKEGTEVKKLVEYLEAWNGQCPLCHWMKHANPWHPIEQCMQDGAYEIKEQSRVMSRGLSYKGFSDFACCHQCGIPQAICNRWEQKEERGWWEEKVERTCQYKEVLIEAVVTMMAEGEDWAIEEILDWMKSEGIKVYDQRAVYRWFRQRVEWGGIEVSRLVQVFCRLVELHEM